jgi:hypothetical protein
MFYQTIFIIPSECSNPNFAPQKEKRNKLLYDNYTVKWNHWISCPTSSNTIEKKNGAETPVASSSRMHFALHEMHYTSFVPSTERMSCFAPRALNSARVPFATRAEKKNV